MQDVVYTLMLTIFEHFTRGEIDHCERNKTLLQNHRRPTLTHFKWYKDTFLNKIMQLMMQITHIENLNL